MKRLLILVIVLLSLPISVKAQVTVDGNLVNTGLTDISNANTFARFSLENYTSQPRVIGTGIMVDLVIDCTQAMIDAGTCKITRNSVIVPSGTYWRACFFNNGTRVRCLDYTVGATFDLNTATPLSVAPAATAPTGDTTYIRSDGGNATNITTSVTFPFGSISTPQTGPTPTQVGSVWYPGTASGLATPPTLAPGHNESAAGGTIAAGTYYFKVTGKNYNGETTGSPSVTITVSGATSSINIALALTDYSYATGYYGYRVYASNDNVTFYLQTPSPTASDFMTDTWTHYVALGSYVAPGLIKSLTFGGTTIPTTNTATIDPLQVALNASRNATPPTTAGTLGGLFVAAVSGGHALTTPLIGFPHDYIFGTGMPSLYNVGQSRISSTWLDNRLATVMIFSAAVRISGIEVYGSGHAMMILGGAATQGQQHFLHYNTIQTNDATLTYSGLVLVGIAYDQYFDRNFIQGSKAVVEFRNVAGGLRYFNGGRWNAGKHIVLSDGAVTDPDNGVNDATFPNGINFWMRDIRTELGSGILFDTPNFRATLEDIEIADPAPAGGTDSVMKIGQNANGGAGTGLKLIRTNLPASGTYRTGIDIGYTSANFGAITIEDGSVGAGASGGPNISIDFHSLTANPLTIRHSATIGASSNSLPHLDPAATTGTLANIHAAQQISSMGAPADQGVGSKAWNEFMDRIVLRTSAARANRQSLFMNGSTMELRGTDDTTVNFSVTSAGVGLFRAGLSITGAFSGATTGAFSGQVTSTLATGTAPFSIASTTNVANLNASSLSGATFAAPGAIGGGTPGSGAFTTVGATGVITSTLATGTAPFTVASTTKSTNLNADLLDDLNTATAATASTVAARDASGRLTVARILAVGTALIDTDFALSGGWGAGATVTAVVGGDQFWRITVTAAGVPGLNPTVTVTFKNGTWTTSPLCATKSNGGTGAVLDYLDAETATTNVITALGTPIAGLTYIVTSSCGARP